MTIPRHVRLYAPDGSVVVDVDLDAERDRERAIYALGGHGPCAHGIWAHEATCAFCATQFVFDGVFERDVQ